MRELTPIEAFASKIATFFLARSTEAGSRTLVAAAAAGDETHGKFMADCHVSRFVVPGRCLDGSS